MKAGKLNWDDLKGIIEEAKSVKREEVLVSNAIGEDCAIIDFKDNKCIVSTDPITGANKGSGTLAVNINCNDIAASGGEPLGILVTILAPTNATLDDIKNIMKEIDKECKKLNVEVIGGHTEVTEAVNKMVISCTVLGKSKKPIPTNGASIGDDIIVTKDLALEGTFIIVNDNIKNCRSFITEDELKEGMSFGSNLSVLEEGKIASKFKVTSMHDITEGGLLGALWEMAKAAEVGFEIYEESLPIREISKKLCNKLKINPLRLISSGSMLIVTSQGKKLIKELESKGIKGTIIGKIIEDKGFIICNNEKIEVEPPLRDELFNIK